MVGLLWTSLHRPGRGTSLRSSDAVNTRSSAAESRHRRHRRAVVDTSSSPCPSSHRDRASPDSRPRRQAFRPRGRAEEHIRFTDFSPAGVKFELEGETALYSAPYHTYMHLLKNLSSGQHVQVMRAGLFCCGRRRSLRLRQGARSPRGFAARIICFSHVTTLVPSRGTSLVPLGPERSIFYPSVPLLCSVPPASIRTPPLLFHCIPQHRWQLSAIPIPIQMYVAKQRWWPWLGLTVLFRFRWRLSTHYIKRPCRLW